MPVIEVQEAIIRTLQSHGEEPLSMHGLLEAMQNANVPSSVEIRSALLPLISLNRIQLTPQRKLRLVGTSVIR